MPSSRCCKLNESLCVCVWVSSRQSGSNGCATTVTATTMPMINLILYPHLSKTTFVLILTFYLLCRSGCVSASSEETARIRMYLISHYTDWTNYNVRAREKSKTTDNKQQQPPKKCKRRDDEDIDGKQNVWEEERLILVCLCVCLCWTCCGGFRFVLFVIWYIQSINIRWKRPTTTNCDPINLISR